MKCANSRSGAVGLHHSTGGPAPPRGTAPDVEDSDNAERSCVVLGRECRLRIHRGKARGGEQQVSLAKRHVERIGECEQEFSAGLRPSTLDEAEMPRRHAGIQRECELTLAAKSAPLLEQKAELTSPCCHFPAR